MCFIIMLSLFFQLLPVFRDFGALLWHFCPFSPLFEAYFVVFNVGINYSISKSNVFGTVFVTMIVHVTVPTIMVL